MLGDGARKPQFEAWVSVNVDRTIPPIELEERDLVDDIDMFYPVERKGLVAVPEEAKNEVEVIPYRDHGEAQNQAIQAAIAAFEQKFGKFSDVMIARYQKKKEEK